MKTQEICNWNRYPRVRANVHTFSKTCELQVLFTRVSKLIARGSGLCYGDASLSDEVVSTLKFNKILHFDKLNGVIRCESGVTLDEILQVIVPAGWFLPVTPGTKLITVGGAIASDVHGKNHHLEGSFSRYVISLTIMNSEGQIIACHAQKNADLFHMTCGGMGLTGVILEIEFRLKRVETSMITQTNIVANNLNEMLEALTKYNNYTYSVAWIDCLSSGRNMGRGILMLGEHSLLNELPPPMLRRPLRVHQPSSLDVPFDAPKFLLNSFTTSLFNRVYFNIKKFSKKKFITHYDAFFYPLDFIKRWNRLYGNSGLMQYQFVVPFSTGEQALSVILNKITESRLASFLSVLKVMGDAEHPLSFGMPGYSLALDFPVSPGLFPLLDELDEVVAHHCGKLYLAKDARMKRWVFGRSYPHSKEIKNCLKKFNGHVKFQSLLSQRLSITS